jgi:exportin-7
MLGVVRDIRGVLRSLTSKPSYSVVFEFLYPTYMPVLIKAVELWTSDPIICVPILKMMTEFVTNKNSRLQMSTSSKNGILLFRETSQMLMKYGEQMGILGTPDPQRLYSHKYKGITVCFAMLKSALLGDYVNFGVFDLYKDPALDNAFDIFFRMLVTIPFEDLSNYPKMCKQYYALLVAISRDHVRYLAISDDFFRYLGTSALEGIKSLDVQVCTQCCTVLDHILTKTVNGLSKSKPDPDSQKLQGFIAKYVGLFQEILRFLLNLVMFEDCKNQWSVSRPLLGLIVVQYEFFTQVRRQIVLAAPAPKQAQYNQCFENLMTGVEQQLSTKNRDKFTQNLAVFRRDLNTFAKSPTVPAGGGAAAEVGGAGAGGGGGAAAAGGGAAAMDA